MSSNDFQDLQKLLCEGFSGIKKELAEHKEILTGLKDEIKAVKEETQEVRGMAEKNDMEGKNRDNRICA